MCGINLIIDKKSQLDQSVIQKMNNTLAHRGPDNSGFFKFNLKNSTVYLGATRLAITPPTSEGNQPILTEDKKYGLSFNGEVYNYSTLQKELRNQRISYSDSQIILKGLINSGKVFFNKLKGMFSLAFVNSDKEEITLARDPKGIKTLYYYEDENYFIASSEIKGILQSGLVEKRLNEEQLYHYLLFRYPKPPETFYKNIYELEPGSVLTYTIEGVVRDKIKAPKIAEPDLNDESLVKNTEELLINAVQSQIPKSVKSGLFLSGGIDSTLLLAIINELGQKNFPTFSIINKQEDTSFGTEDYKFIEKSIKLFGHESHVIETDSSLLESFPDFVKMIDQPVADNAYWLTWVLSQSAIKSVKTVFSGAGADEYFGGYNRQKAFQYYLNIAPIGTPLMKKLAMFSEGKESPFRKSFRLANKFFSSIESEPAKTWENFTAFMELKKGYLKNEGSYKGAEFHKGKDLLKQAFEDDQNRYLVSDVLKITDNASMAAGLEVRVPYLDSDLKAFASSIPAKTLLKNGQKWILKELLQKRGGKAFIDRPKEGFGMPFGKWLKGKHGPPVLKYLRGGTLLMEYCNQKKIDNLLDLHLNDKKDYTGELFSLILLSAWLEREFS